MKGIILTVALVCAAALLSGCCTQDICNMGSTYVPATTNKKCNNCSTCGTCGYDTSYTYSGWY